MIISPTFSVFGMLASVLVMLWYMNSSILPFVQQHANARLYCAVCVDSKQRGFGTEPECFITTDLALGSVICSEYAEYVSALKADYIDI